MGRRNFIVRILLVAVLFLAVFLMLLFRLYHVQIERHAELYEKAKKTYTSIAKKEGKRGEIFDVGGNLLVGNIPCIDVAADPQMTGSEKDYDDMAFFFHKELDVPYFDVLRRLSAKTREDGRNIHYVVIKKGIDFDRGKEIREKVKKLSYKGIIFENRTKRYYPKGRLLANVLGFTDAEETAVIGIEKAVNEDIKPTAVKSSYERDRKGTPFAGEEEKISEVRDGNNIYLTISEPIQLIVEEELDRLVGEFEPAAAYGIMADPYTGNILAMAQRPTFDPNDRSAIKPEAWRDRIISDAFEPGSVMKAVTVSGALDYGIVNPASLISCESGAWFYTGKILRDAHPYETLTVTEVIQKSSNIGTAKIAVMMGRERLYQVFRRFGFGKKTGIPIQPEATGIVRPLEKWDPLSITRFPIGQGISVSPLQLVRAYCAIANGGKLVELRLIDHEENPSTGEIIKKEFIPATYVFRNGNTCSKIVNMLKLVTQKGGTAERAAVKGYDVAGKTGTSQKWVNGAYSETLFHSSFIGFVPADNPAFVLLVMADEPGKNHYGGVVSAPSFSRIAKKTLRFLNIPPQYEVPAEELDEKL